MKTLCKIVAGVTLALFPAVPVLAQDPSPGCDDGEVLINGECTELEDTIIVNGSRDGSSGGQSGLGGGTGANYRGSSNNGYAGRPGGSSGGTSGGTAGGSTLVDPANCPAGQRPSYIPDGSGVPVFTGCEEIPDPCGMLAAAGLLAGADSAAQGQTANNHHREGRPGMGNRAAGRGLAGAVVALAAGVASLTCL